MEVEEEPTDEGFMPHVEIIDKSTMVDYDNEEMQADPSGKYYDLPDLDTPEAEYQEPLHFVSREEWGALPPLDPVPIEKYPIKYVVYTMSTRRQSCMSKAECSGVLQRLQKKHMKEGMSDIAYNFLVGRDGTVFEGRGWKVKSAKNLKYNPALYGRRIDIAFIGDFATAYIPPADMLEGSQNIQRLGISEKYLVDGHDVLRIYTWRRRLREGRATEFPTAEEWLLKKYHTPEEFDLPPIYATKKSWKGI